MNIKQNQAQFKLPDVEEVKSQLKGIHDLELVKERIQEVIQVLGDFKNRAESGRNRKEYLEVIDGINTYINT